LPLVRFKAKLTKAQSIIVNFGVIAI